MVNLKFIKQIGRGGFGNVDLVEDEAGRQFARKTFAPNQPMNAKLLDNVAKRFAKEIRIQKEISHANIVPIVSEHLSANPPYYLMPLAIGTLADDLETDRTLGGDFISAISDIVAGLEELHSMQIYHRDLKPQNVLRMPKGDEPGKFFYAISDFGLVSMKESQLSALTKTGMRMGSDYYTAPEITKDLRRASVQSDVYSLGCILHSMTGSQDRVPCGEIREPGDFSAILLGCTRKDHSQRFKSVRAVLDAILSVDVTSTTALTEASSNFIDVLEGNVAPSLDYWNSLAEFLEHDASTGEEAAIFRKLNTEHIQNVCIAATDYANRIGIAFAQWVDRSSFNFEYCDALANRLEEFFNLTAFECKVECLTALLSMGTSHNRWFVERKFFQLCGPEMDDSLAKRVAIQFRIAGSAICADIAHLEDSIGVNRTGFHPTLAKTLDEICS